MTLAVAVLILILAPIGFLAALFRSMGLRGGLQVLGAIAICGGASVVLVWALRTVFP